MKTTAHESSNEAGPRPELRENPNADLESRVDATLLLCSAVLFILYVLGVLPWLWQIFFPDG